MGLIEEADAELEAVYAQVPEVNCRGFCADCCGPVDGGHREMVRIARAGAKLPPRRVALLQMLRNGGEYSCPALVDGRCSVYSVRPAICRVFGASADLVCPYGCKPAAGVELLSSAQTLAILEAARCAGTREQPKSAAYFEAMLERPAIARLYRSMIFKFTATHPDAPVLRRPGLDRVKNTAPRKRTPKRRDPGEQQLRSSLRRHEEEIRRLLGEVEGGAPGRR